MVINQKKIFLIALVIFSLDQIAKFLILTNIDKLPFNVFPGLISLTYTTNTGLAFGLLKGNNLPFTVISVVVAITIIVIRKKISNKLEFLAAAFILGGTLGNLTDRLLRGSVVDYISVPFVPIFNIADTMLTIGATLIITSFVEEKIANSRKLRKRK